MRLLVICALLALALSTAAQYESNFDEDLTQVLSAPEDCARDCQPGEKPKTCYYKWTVEYYATMNDACGLRPGCPSNKTIKLADDCQCILGDGYERAGIITANRMYPGPAMIICKYDNVVVDVENRVPGNAITIHWHGILQLGTQYDDGIPFVTQCPINEGTSWRYQWKARNSGTHFWHAHSGLHKGEGLMGPLIVREPKATDVNSQLWDVDSIDTIIYLTDWFHGSSADHFPGTVRRNTRQLPDNFLINGMGRWHDPVAGNTTTTPLATFTVKQGSSYRFRLINACNMACPLKMTIQEHNVTVIQSDGLPLVPAEVTTITSSAAERFDFVLKANKKIGTYWIQFRAIGECDELKLQQLAYLRYETAPDQPLIKAPTIDARLNNGLVFNDLNVHCDDPSSPPGSLCFSQLRSARPMPRALAKRRPDIKMYLGFSFYDYQLDSIYKPGTYKTVLVVAAEPTAANSVAYVDNITMVFPASPLLSQRRDIPQSQICSANNVPATCTGPEPCPCTHVEEIPLNAVVEIFLVDKLGIPNLSHPFHLHGHTFYVVGGGSREQYNVENFTLPILKNLDDQGLIKRQLTNPPAKDSFAIPNNGFTVIRFLANNPGYWLFHCHFEFHLASGMVTVFHVGDARDVRRPPRGFPKCGNYKPPVRPEYT